jgi:ATPase subunit of ABC transporter with duplicated ATPase domains
LIGIFVFQERVTPGEAVLLLFLSDKIYMSLLGVYEQIVYFAENRMARERLKRVSESRNGNSPVSLHNKKEIRFEGCRVAVDAQTILETGVISIVSGMPNIIMGENGSGKTTLLKVLAGFIQPNQCQICSTTEDNDSDVLYLSQEDLCLQESALELIDISEHSAYISFCKKWFDITEEKLNHPIRTLSGGERKKVFLALAFIKRENNFLLLDEPTNHLDSPAKLCLAQIISERPEKLVLVSHDIEFLEALKSKTDISITRVMKGE